MKVLYKSYFYAEDAITFCTFHADSLQYVVQTTSMSDSSSYMGLKRILNGPFSIWSPKECTFFLKSISKGKWVIPDDFGEEEEGSEEADVEEDACLSCF